jgi:hypothetical protein
MNEECGLLANVVRVVAINTLEDPSWSSEIYILLVTDSSLWRPSFLFVKQKAMCLKSCEIGEQGGFNSFVLSNLVAIANNVKQGIEVIWISETNSCSTFKKKCLDISGK